MHRYFGAPVADLFLDDDSAELVRNLARRSVGEIEVRELDAQAFAEGNGLPLLCIDGESSALTLQQMVGSSFWDRIGEVLIFRLRTVAGTEPRFVVIIVKPHEGLYNHHAGLVVPSLHALGEAIKAAILEVEDYYRISKENGFDLFDLDLESATKAANILLQHQREIRVLRNEVRERMATEKVLSSPAKDPAWPPTAETANGLEMPDCLLYCDPEPEQEAGQESEPDSPSNALAAPKQPRNEPDYRAKLRQMELSPEIRQFIQSVDVHNVLGLEAKRGADPLSSGVQADLDSLHPETPENCAGARKSLLDSLLEEEPVDFCETSTPRSRTMESTLRIWAASTLKRTLSPFLQAMPTSLSGGTNSSCRPASRRTRSSSPARCTTSAQSGRILANSV